MLERSKKTFTLRKRPSGTAKGWSLPTATGSEKVVPSLLLATLTVRRASPQSCAFHCARPQCAPSWPLSWTKDQVPLGGAPLSVLPVMSL